MPKRNVDRHDNTKHNLAVEAAFDSMSAALERFRSNLATAETAELVAYYAHEISRLLGARDGLNRELGRYER